MRHYVFLLVAFLFVACGGGEQQHVPVVKPDSQHVDTLGRVKATTATANEEVGPTLQEVLDDMKDEYERPLVVDTVFHMRGKELHLYVKHYCLMDSAIRIPKRYIFWDSLDSYVTHNLVTQVKLEEGDKALLERTIRKEDFRQLLYPDYSNLDSFAVLLRPNVDLKGDKIRLGYSISIPLTDLGVGCDALIDEKGVISFVAH